MKRLFQKKKFRVIVRGASAIISFFAVTTVFADSPSFESLTGNLQLNRIQLEYLDLSLTNLTVEGERRNDLEKEFRDALKYDYHSNIALMTGNYNEGHKVLLTGRTHLHSVYVRVLEYYLEETAAMFKSVAPLIVRTRDPDAGYFLRIGYNNLGQAKTIHTMAFNTYPGNDVNKIESYRESIRYVRLSRRYLMLSLVNANLPREEKPAHEYIGYNQAKNGVDETESVDNYEKIRYLLLRLIERKLVAEDIRVRVNEETRKIPILDIHRDNYGFLVLDKVSARKRLIESLENEDFNTQGLRPESSSGAGTQPQGAEQESTAPVGSPTNP